MTPIVVHPKFLPRQINTRFREKGINIRLMDCIKEDQCKSLEEIRNILNPPFTIWQAMQITYFLKSLYVEIKKLPSITGV